MTSVRLDQFTGCLLGQAIADGLGAPYEGLPADHIYWVFGETSKLALNPSGETLCYTDDTQMMIGVAETLIDHGTIVDERLCRAFADNYDPARCYGPGARRILDAMVGGEDWRELTQSQFPGGSYGNGAAMRAAPLGLLFCHDHARLMEEVKRSAEPTHLHPLGIEGAQLLALSVAIAVTQTKFDRREFYKTLMSHCQSDEFRWQLKAAAKMRPTSGTLSIFGNSLEAHRSVIASIAAFTTTPRSYPDAVGRAIGLGNDTDTLAAMTGAISGAHLGEQAIPQHLIEQLEDNEKGRTYIRDLASKLHSRLTGH